MSPMPLDKLNCSNIMEHMNKKYILLALAGLIILIGLSAQMALADHSWGGYHWARTANPFTLELGDNVSSSWDNYLATTANDWSLSNVLDTVVKPGKTNPRACRATDGRVEVCSNKYGFTGWLGVAQIWVSGQHIAKGTVRVNDSYYNTSTYNTPSWRNFVMCQEVGHTLGLDHQDEIFGNPNLDTCMDYSSNPLTNQHPNQHDYDILEGIYSHLDSVNSILSSTKGGSGKSSDIRQEIDPDEQSEWGREVRREKRDDRSLYVRELRNGEKIFTFVIWAL